MNTLKTTLQDQLDTTFKDFTRVTSVRDVITTGSTTTGKKLLYIDEHVPNLLALSPTFEITKTHAYTSGAIILQDKASCFPAYLLDPQPADGDVIDSCSAPGNKTTHVAAIVRARVSENEVCTRKVYAFEKDPHRAHTLDKMVNLAGAQEITRMSLGQDFLKVDPNAPLYANVGSLLLDPSCSGSGIVGRDAMPTIHLPEQPGAKTATTNNKKPPANKNRKRKREDGDKGEGEGEGEEKSRSKRTLVDDDGQESVVSSDKELKARLEALSAFQLTLLQHAFSFPAARRITYSTCSIHAEENEHVVLKALDSEIAVQCGWRIMKRAEQVKGMRVWPVRGDIAGSAGDQEVAEACIRSYKDDGRGVMGFFVAGFVRDIEGDDRRDGGRDAGVVVSGGNGDVNTSTPTTTTTTTTATTRDKEISRLASKEKKVQGRGQVTDTLPQKDTGKEGKSSEAKAKDVLGGKESDSDSDTSDSDEESDDDTTTTASDSDEDEEWGGFAD